MEAGFASAGGNCQNQTMPRSCAGLFAAGPDGGAGGNLPQTMGELGEDGAFFAAVTGPLDKGDQTQVGAVAGWVFPVVLSWTHGGRDGSDPGETRAHVACVRAAAAGSLGAGAGNNGPGGIGFLDNGTSGSSMLRSGVGWWGQWVVLGVVVAWGLV
ncbi:hypothetical protein B0H67DRAFT_594664 [Lasiosphaeris hirsuta]|uniref:Uncharacterized protein n=1 Tax=Lasiosphaeris hirsuta TaxID=260670 RepID=A0AA40DLX3_9PEZI|nr:hypothetical protein B0H67DRAFT_594664 [Lasiosphaeris hirsuta]